MLKPAICIEARAEFTDGFALFLTSLHADVVFLFAGRRCVVCPACLLLIGARLAATLRPRLGRSAAKSEANENGDGQDPHD